MSLPKLDEAHVVITGKYNGFDVSLEGDVEDVVVDTEEDEEDWREDFFSDQYADPLKTLVQPMQYVVKFKPKDSGEQFVYKVQPKKVYHSATLETIGETHPAYNIERYRDMVKAPKYSTWRYDTDEKLITIEWTEEVYG